MYASVQVDSTYMHCKTITISLLTPNVLCANYRYRLCKELMFILQKAYLLLMRTDVEHVLHTVVRLLHGYEEGVPQSCAHQNNVYQIDKQQV